MADTLKINFQANIAQVRKAFAEQSKLQQKTWKVRKKQLRVENKFQRSEKKQFKDIEKRKQTQFRHEMQQTKRLKVEKGRSFTQERRHSDQMSRDQASTQRRDRDHLQKVNRDLKKGPMGRMGRMGRFAKRTAAFGAMGAIGLVLGAVIKGYQDYVSQQKSLAPNIGLGSIGEASQKGGTGLGFNIIERGQLAGASGRATGALDPKAMMRMQRATAMGTGEVASLFKTMRQGGTQFSGLAEKMNMQTGVSKEVRQEGSAEKKLAKVISLGMYSGLERARMPEFFKTSQSLMENQIAAAGGEVDITQMAKFAAMMGNKGGIAFQGTRGGNLMNKMDQAVRNPQSAENVAFLQRAFGYGRPGGGTNFYDARKRQQQGITGEGNFNAIMSQVEAEAGTVKQGALRLEEVLGVSLEQAEALQKLRESGETGTQLQKSIKQIMAGSKTLEEQARAQMDKANTNLAHIAGLFDQSVVRGAEAADGIEKFQTLMAELLSSIIEGIKSVVVAIQGLPGWKGTEWKGGDIDEIKASYSEKTIQLRKLEKQWGKTKDPQEREELALRMEKIAQSRTMTASGAAPTGIMDFLSKAPNPEVIKQKQLRRVSELASPKSTFRKIAYQEFGGEVLPEDAGKIDKIVSETYNQYLNQRKAGASHTSAKSDAQILMKAKLRTYFKNKKTGTSVKKAEERKKDKAKTDAKVIPIVEDAGKSIERASQESQKIDVGVIVEQPPRSSADSPAVGATTTAKPRPPATGGTIIESR